MSIRSAHLLAFLALVLAAGGGFAIAQSGTAKPNYVYHESFDKPFRQPGGRANLVVQVVVPVPGTYLANAKLDVSRAVRSKGGPVTCHLGAIGNGDRSRVTVASGASHDVALLAFGTAASPLSGGTQALDLYCETPKGSSPYSVSNVRVTAMSVDGLKTQTP